LRFSPNSTDFQADYITVVKDRRIMSVKYCLPVPVFHFGQNYNAPCSAVSQLKYLIRLYLIRFTGWYL